ncbi:MAG: hypothetical protein KF816_17375 [Melioribacteraceae bacterium]|nr:hypothetical protein [Melioribacteraceae bacterium]
MNNYDLYWWITALIVGICSNIITNYLIKKYGDVIAKYSKRFREHRSKKVKQRNELIDLLSKNDFYMQHYYHKEIRYNFHGSVMALGTIFLCMLFLFLKSSSEHSTLVTFLFFFIFICAFFSAYLANYCFRKSIEIGHILSDVFIIKKNNSMHSA